MTATSVTGIGPGAAEITRGPGNGRNQFYSVVDPHVVWHGTATLIQGTVTVYLPSTLAVVPPTHYAVFVAGKGYATAKITDASGNMTGFRIVGYGDYVDYIVVDANNTCFCEDHTEPS